jgi:hypothetical protein
VLEHHHVPAELQPPLLTGRQVRVIVPFDARVMLNWSPRVEVAVTVYLLPPPETDVPVEGST